MAQPSYKGIIQGLHRDLIKRLLGCKKGVSLYELQPISGIGGPHEGRA